MPSSGKDLDRGGPSRRCAAIDYTLISHRRALYWVFSCALAAALVYWVFRKLDWHAVGASIAAADPMSVFAAALIASLALFVRSLRWRVLLTLSSPISIPCVFWATAAGYFGNYLLPARAGEAIRTVLISSASDLRRSFVLATALSERLADAIALIFVGGGVLMILPGAPPWLLAAARPLSIVSACGVLGIIVLPLTEGFWMPALANFQSRYSWAERLTIVIGNVLNGLRGFHSLSRLAQFAGMSIIIWGLDVSTTVVCARAIHVGLSVGVALLLLAGLGLASVIPSTPGSVGLYQFVAVSLLTPVGLSKVQALVFIILFQAINYVVVLSCGAVGIARYSTYKRTASPRSGNTCSSHSGV